MDIQIDRTYLTDTKYHKNNNKVLILHLGWIRQVSDRWRWWRWNSRNSSAALKWRQSHLKTNKININILKTHLEQLYVLTIGWRADLEQAGVLDQSRYVTGHPSHIQYLSGFERWQEWALYSPQICSILFEFSFVNCLYFLWHCHHPMFGLGNCKLENKQKINFL